MRFKELYKKTLLGTTKVKVLEVAETDEDGYTATPVMSCLWMHLQYLSARAFPWAESMQSICVSQAHGSGDFRH